MKIILASCLLLSAGLSLGAASAPPAWVLDAAKVTVRPYPPETRGVIVFDETRITVDGGGTIRSQHRRAIRILNTSGRDLSVAQASADRETKVTDFRGWTIPPAGQSFEVSDRDVVETSVSEGELYGDQKIRLLRLPAPSPGSLVAYEYSRRERPYALQHEWEFQQELPVEKATLTIDLPEGWGREVHWIHAPAADPIVTGKSATWTVTGVPGIESEPGMPAVRALAGRLAVNFLSPGDSARVHTSWNDVGAWYARLIAGRREASKELRAKAMQLAPSGDLLSRIRAISRFLQTDVRYVAIEIGIGGFQPHPAADIFRNRYGDCKDKVTLMSAMLKELGVESYYVLVNTSRGVVQRDFATHATFNHAVLAIQLPAGLKTTLLHSTIPNSSVGPLLIFDPTNDLTPLGELPGYLQDSDALLVTEAGGELIRLPEMKPESHRIDVTARMVLDADGTLHGQVREVRSGWPAAHYRAAIRSKGESDRTKLLQQYLSRSFSSFNVTELKFENVDEIDREFVVSYTVAAPAYARNAGSMILVRPRIIGRKAEGILDLKERKFGYELDPPSLETDSVSIALPASWKVDELPAEQKIALPQFSYSSKSSATGAILSYKREYRLTKVDVPLEQLPTLNGALRQILADERNSAVLLPAGK